MCISLTPAILLRRTINNAAGERSEPAASVSRRQQQLLVMWHGRLRKTRKHEGHAEENGGADPPDLERQGPRGLTFRRVELGAYQRRARFESLWI